MIKVFNKLSEYYTYINGGLNSGDLYYVKEDESVHFQTNNIDGSLSVYDYAPEGADSDSLVLVDGSFTENGEYDPADYDADGFSIVAISVPVPEGYVIPSGNLAISSNGSNIDVAQYSTVAVSVASSIPEGYILPSGNLNISSNASNIDVAQYASVAVSVAIPEGYVLPSGNLNISSNASSIDVAQYETVSVNVSSAPSLSWNTVTNTISLNSVDCKYLNCTVGDTYVFKTNVSGVVIYHMPYDSSMDGVIDFDDDAIVYGLMTPNKEYYLTIAYGTQDGDVSAENIPVVFSGGDGYDDNITSPGLPEGAVVQYAVLPTA